LLQAKESTEATLADIHLTKLIRTLNGNISIVAADSITQTVTGDIMDYSKTASVELQAADNITMADGALTRAEGGNVRYQAGIDIIVGGINATTGGISLLAGNRIYDGGDVDIDLVAENLRIQAGTGIGLSTNLMDTSVNKFSAVATNGGIFINEDSSITVTDVAITVTRVAANATTSLINDIAQSDLSTSLNGAIILTAENNITLTEGVDADALAVVAIGSGNVLIESRTANIIQQSAINGGTGNISLLANIEISQTATGDVFTSGTATIDFNAGRDIFMSDGATSTTANSNIRFNAGHDITLGGLNAGTANVSLTAGNSLFDGGDSDLEVVAANLRVQAGNGIGLGTNLIDINVDVLSAVATSGGIFFNEQDNIRVDQTPTISINRVTSDSGSFIVTDSVQSDLSTSLNGSIVLSAGSNITLTDGGDADALAVVAIGSGNVLIESRASNIIQQSAINGGTGNVSLLANIDISQTATGDVFTSGTATIDFNAGRDIFMSDGATSTTANSNIRFNAGHDITLGGLNAGTASVSLIAGNSIWDGGDSDLEVVAANLRAQAGNAIGTGAKLIDINVDVLSAVSTSGGIFFNEQDNIRIDQTPTISINRVTSDASSFIVTDSVQSDLTTTLNGAIVLTAENNITLTDGVDADALAIVAIGSGNVLIESRTANIIQQSAINGGTGNISLLANIDISQTATGDVFTSGTGTIDFNAGRDIFMSDGATSTTANSNIRFNAGHDITLGGLNAGTTGSVSLIASNSLFDGGDADLEVVAANLRVQAGNGIGLGANLIDINVDVLSAVATSGGIFFNEQDNIRVDQTPTISINRVTSDSGSFIVTDSVQSDLSTSLNGSIVLSAGSNITLTDGGDADALAVVAIGSGNVLIESRASNIIQQSAINGGTGNVSLLANIDISQTATGDVFTSGTATIDFNAGRDIFMADGATSKTANSNIRFNAGHDITLGGLNAGTANVSLTAGNSLFDGGDSDLEVVAANLRVQAGNGIGTGAKLIDINVDVLSAVATSGGIFFNEQDNIRIDQTPTISINRVTSNASSFIVTDSVQSDLSTSLNGSIVLSAGSNITLTDAGDADGLAVVAIGSGNVLIESRTANIIQQSAINGGTGNISLLAKVDITQTPVADVFTIGTGTIEFDAGHDIFMADGTIAQTLNSNIRLNAGHDITLGGLKAGTASVSLLAGNNIIDGGETDLEVIAANLRIQAGNAVGTGTNLIDIDVDNLSVNANTGGLFINEMSSITVTKLAEISVNRVATNATTSITLTTDATQSDLTTHTNGDIILTANNNITLSDGDTNNIGINASAGYGNVLIESRTANIYQEAVINSGTGNISLLTAIDIQQTDTGDIITSGTGTIDVNAGRDILMANGAISKTSNSNIRFNAGNNITLGGLNAGTASVSLLAGNNIIDGGDTNIDVVAANLRIQAGHAVGTGADLIDIDVDNLSVNTNTGGVFINEMSSVTVSKLAEISVNRVATNSTTSITSTTDAIQSDLTTHTNGDIILTANNNVTLLDGDTNNISINASAGYGNVLIESRTANIYQQSVINGGTGNISLLAKVDIQQTATGDIFTSGTGTIELAAGNTIKMADGAFTQSQNSDIRFYAANNIVLGGINAGTAAVSLIAGNSIIDGGDTDMDVRAAQLRINAGLGAGSGNAGLLDISVDILSASATSGGLFINEENNLVIAETRQITVNHVLTNAKTTAIVDSAQSDLSTVNNGAIIVTAAGDINLTDGGNNNGIAVQALGIGNVFINASAGSITQSAIVNGGTGNISMIASNNIIQTATGDIITAGNGTIDMDAVHNIIMYDGATIQSNNSNIRLNARVNDILLGGIMAGSGSVSLISGNNILDNGDSNLDVIAANLRIQAANGAGTRANLLDINVDNITTITGAGGLFINEQDSITIATLDDIVVNRVRLNGLADTAVNDHSISGLTTNGEILLTNPDNINQNTNVLTNSGSIEFISTGGSLTMLANTHTWSNGGNITINVKQDIGLAFVDTTTSGYYQSAFYNADSFNFDRTVHSSTGNFDTTLHYSAGAGDVSLIGDGTVYDVHAGNDTNLYAGQLNMYIHGPDIAASVASDINPYAINISVDRYYLATQYNPFAYVTYLGGDKQALLHEGTRITTQFILQDYADVSLLPTMGANNGYNYQTIKAWTNLIIDYNRSAYGYQAAPTFTNFVNNSNSKFFGAVRDNNSNSNNNNANLLGITNNNAIPDYFALRNQINPFQYANSDLLQLFVSGDFILDGADENDDDFSFFNSDFNHQEIITALSGVSGYYDTNDLFNFWTESIEL
jgi:hypothetical protein